MRTYRLDYLQDAEHGGHHLDREIGKLEISKYPAATQTVIHMLQRTQICAPAGYELVAAIAVQTIVREQKDWHMGDYQYFDVMPGMLVMNNNHITLWLRDSEARARYLLASIFHKELFEVCGRGSESALYEFVTLRIRELTRKALLKRHDAFQEALEGLQKIQDEQVLFQDVLNAV